MRGADRTTATTGSTAAVGSTTPCTSTHRSRCRPSSLAARRAGGDGLAGADRGADRIAPQRHADEERTRELPRRSRGRRRHESRGRERLPRRRPRPRHLKGGKGVDTADYFFSRQGVTVNLGAGVAYGYGRDRISNVEDADGSRFKDVLIGNASPNWIRGFGGNDIIVGGAAPTASKAGTAAIACAGDGGTIESRAARGAIASSAGPAGTASRAARGATVARTASA
jgi:hypothetical protein